jgi:hypothetical protein
MHHLLYAAQSKARAEGVCQIWSSIGVKGTELREYIHRPPSPKVY